MVIAGHRILIYGPLRFLYPRKIMTFVEIFVNYLLRYNPDISQHNRPFPLESCLESMSVVFALANNCKGRSKRE